MRAETPGPGIAKLTPYIAETARVLWIAYVGLTILYIALLYGAHLVGYAPNMSLYNAIVTALPRPTGGFSPEVRSMEAFSLLVQWLVIPSMFVAGVNFVLWWHAITGDPLRLLRDNEFRAYLVSSRFLPSAVRPCSVPLHSRRHILARLAGTSGERCGTPRFRSIR